MFAGNSISGGLLERKAILRHILKAILPHQGNVASVGRREPPGHEGRDGISANYEDISELLLLLRWFDSHCGLAGGVGREGSNQERSYARAAYD